MNFDILVVFWQEICTRWLTESEQNH